MPRPEPLSVVTEPQDEGEDDLRAEEELIAAFANVRSRERTEFAVVELRRWQDVPKRDRQGRLVRVDGALVRGPLELYFQRLLPGTFSDLRARHTRMVPRRERGRTVYDERLDDESFAWDLAYTALVPWCRQRYFDDERLWGDDPVGTGLDFMRQRLNLDELGRCQEAVLALEGMTDERAQALGKA